MGSNGSQNNPIPVLEFDFNCKSHIVGYDIEMFIFPFLVYNDAFFDQDDSFGMGSFGFDNRLLRVVWVQNVASLLRLLSVRLSGSLIPCM